MCCRGRVAAERGEEGAPSRLTPRSDLHVVSLPASHCHHPAIRQPLQSPSHPASHSVGDPANRWRLVPPQSTNAQHAFSVYKHMLRISAIQLDLLIVALSWWPHTRLPLPTAAMSSACAHRRSPPLHVSSGIAVAPEPKCPANWTGLGWIGSGPNVTLIGPDWAGSNRTQLDPHRVPSSHRLHSGRLDPLHPNWRSGPVRPVQLAGPRADVDICQLETMDGDAEARPGDQSTDARAPPTPPSLAVARFTTGEIPPAR